MSDATKPLNGYLAFYRGKQLEVYAATSGDAYEEAAKRFKVKPKYKHQVHVHLCEVAGQTVEHTLGG